MSKLGLTIVPAGPPSAASVPSRFQGLFRRPDGSTAGGGIFVGPKSLTVTRPGDRSGSTICYTSGSSVTRYGDFGGSPVVYAALSFAAPLMPGVSSDTICIVVIMASGGQGPPVAFARASSSSSDCTVFSISGTLQSNTVGLSDDPQLNGFLVAVAYYDPPPLCSNFLTYTDNAFPGVPVWARATVAGNTVRPLCCCQAAFSVGFLFVLLSVPQGRGISHLARKRLISCGCYSFSCYHSVLRCHCHTALLPPRVFGAGLRTLLAHYVRQLRDGERSGLDVFNVSSRGNYVLLRQQHCIRRGTAQHDSHCDLALQLYLITG